MIDVLIFILHHLHSLLMLFGGSWRTVAWKFGSFGGIGTGILTWLGIAFVYPAVVGAQTPESQWAWAVLGVCAYVKTMAQWCGATLEAENTGQCWLGRFEWLLAATLSLAVGGWVGAHAGLFVAFAYACSTAQVLIVRALRRLETWTRWDTIRLMQPFNDARDWGASAAPVAGRFAKVTGQRLADVGSFMFRTAKQAVWTKPQPAPVMAGGNVFFLPPQPGILARVFNWVKTMMINNFIFSLITGAISIKLIATYVMTWSLRSIGADVTLPDELTAPVRGVVVRARDAARNTKDKAIEILEDKKEDLTEAWRERKESASERLEESRRAVQGRIREEALRQTKRTILGRQDGPSENQLPSFDISFEDFVKAVGEHR